MECIVVSGQRTSTLRGDGSQTGLMSLERDHDCPTCDEERTFYRAASTMVRLGEKVKWRCPDCEYSFVTIGDDVDSSATA